jgi:hypothetical protein
MIKIILKQGDLQYIHRLRAHIICPIVAAALTWQIRKVSTSLLKTDTATQFSEKNPVSNTYPNFISEFLLAI